MPFSLGKVKLNKRKGTARLPVSVPGAGRLSLAGKGVKRRRPGRARGALISKTVTGPGTVDLLIRPKGKAKRKLTRTGKARVKVKVTYTPAGGDPKTRTKRIKLIRRR